MMKWWWRNSGNFISTLICDVRFSFLVMNTLWIVTQLLLDWQSLMMFAGRWQCDDNFWIAMIQTQLMNEMWITRVIWKKCRAWVMRVFYVVFVYLSVFCLSVCFFVCLSIFLSFFAFLLRLSVVPSVGLSFFVCLLCFIVCLSFCFSTSYLLFFVFLSIS
jgi:hypothetical protein